MTLTKDVLVDMMKEKLGLAAKESKDLLEMILEQMKARLEQGEEIKISGFGKWLVRDKHTRRGRNPHTGRPMEISARRVVTFRPSERLREAVNSGMLRADDRPPRTQPK